MEEGKLDAIEQRNVSLFMIQEMETAIAQPYLFDLRPGWCGFDHNGFGFLRFLLRRRVFRQVFRG
jgi:hypothetical protein